jgi:Tfp pilus assembly protein PilO
MKKILILTAVVAVTALQPAFAMSQKLDEDIMDEAAEIQLKAEFIKDVMRERLKMSIEALYQVSLIDKEIPLCGDSLACKLEKRKKIADWLERTEKNLKIYDEYREQLIDLERQRKNLYLQLKKK